MVMRRRWLAANLRCHRVSSRSWRDAGLRSRPGPHATQLLLGRRMRGEEQQERAAQPTWHVHRGASRGLLGEGGLKHTDGTRDTKQGK